MSMLSSLVTTLRKEITPNEKQPTLGHVAELTNQMLVYKHRRVTQRIVIRKIVSE